MGADLGVVPRLAAGLQAVLGVEGHRRHPRVAPDDAAALGAIPVLQTQPAIDVRNAPERARIAEFAQAIRDVAAAQGVILIDQFARFAEMGRGHVNDIAWGLLGDPFHPNAAGHAVLALGVATALELAPLPERDRVLPALRALAHAAR